MCLPNFTSSLFLLYHFSLNVAIVCKKQIKVKEDSNGRNHFFWSASHKDAISLVQIPVKKIACRLRQTLCFIFVKKMSMYLALKIILLLYTSPKWKLNSHGHIQMLCI